MIQFVSLVAVVYAGLVGSLYIFQRNLLYHPAAAMPTPAESGVPEMDAVSLETADGLRLTSWYEPATDGRPTLVYLCGNAGHLGYRASKVRHFLDAGYGVLLVGYRGFGGNPGRPSEAGLYLDGQAALGFLEGEGITADRTVLYGESLGSGVAVHIAHEQAKDQPVAAVLLEAPYTSIADLAAHHYPFAPARWLVKDRFETETKIAGVGAPLLIFQAEDDRVIPVRYGKRLFEAAAEPKEAHWLPNGGHNGLYDVGAPEIALEFLGRLVAPTPAIPTGDEREGDPS